MLIENGALVKPVYEMDVSGNMKDFWNGLLEIGNDPHVYSGWRTPTLRFGNVQFSAGCGTHLTLWVDDAIQVACSCVAANSVQP